MGSDGHAAPDGVQYRLTDTFPPDRWNSTTMTLRADYSRKLRAMGIFRFQSVANVDEKLDVIVGLRRLNTMQWKGWCFQLACRGRTLEATFLDINGRIAAMTVAKTADLSRTLRDVLGDDPYLVSATVEGMQLQGRLYISVLVSPTPEIQTSRTLPNMAPQHQMPSASLFHKPSVRMLTWPFFEGRADSSEFVDGAEPAPDTLPPVRGRPPADDGMDSPSSRFMKPMYDFIAGLRERREPLNESQPKAPAQLSEYLVRALFDGDVAKVEAMLAGEPDLEARTSDVYSFAPLHWAVAGGSSECVRLVLEHGANLLGVTREGALAASHMAALCNARVRSTFESRYGPKTGLSDLGNMRTRRHLDAPLHLAAAASYNSEHGLALFYRLETLGTPWPRNRDNETPLHRATANNNKGVLGAIKARSFHLDVGAADRYGRTPLWHAATADVVDAINTLAMLGVIIGLTDDLDRIPLHAACRGGHDGAIELLLRLEARQRTQTHVWSLTAMDYAAMFGHMRCLPSLLDADPLPSDPDPDDFTSFASRCKALHIAASCGWFDELCRWGADPSVARGQYVKLDESKTFTAVVDVEDARLAALREGHEEIVKYFDTLPGKPWYRYPGAEGRTGHAVPQGSMVSH